MTRRQYRYGSSAGLTDGHTNRAINVFVLNRVNPQLEAMLALEQPPRRLQRRVSVQNPPIVRPNAIQQRRNSLPAAIAAVPDATPFNRSQVLQDLGMGQLLQLDDSDDDVCFLVFFYTHFQPVKPVKLEKNVFIYIRFIFSIRRVTLVWKRRIVHRFLHTIQFLAERKSFRSNRIILPNK